MRVLRVILAPVRLLWRVIYAGGVLVASFALLSLAVVFAKVRKDGDDLADQIEEDAAITQHQEEDETDDSERRWFIDLGPEGQARMIARVHAAHAFRPDPMLGVMKNRGRRIG